MRFLTCCLLTSAVVIPAAANADALKLKPLIDTRLRYENVDQTGIAKKANALTARARLGLEATSGQFVFLAEAEGVLALDNNYFSGVNSKSATYPIVADPQNVELNRVQLQYKGLPKTVVTVGRQRINLDDQRFVGSVGWRQNEQTFDAVRVTWAGLPRLSIDASYVWSVRTVNGVDGTGARPTAIPGSNWFGLVSYAAPIGTLTGFAYLVDQDLAAVQGFRLSSQSYGVRFAGSRPIAPGWKIGYIASAARQSDYRRNPNRYAASYYLAEANVSGKVLAATAGYEVLGADHGTALTSFQTPLASLFRFQGWAGKFGTTPPNGIRDLYGTLGANWKTKGLISGVGLGATWHHFDSDRLSQHYGDELDLLAQAKLKRFTVAARLARYKADQFQTDTTKGFLSVEWVL
jgi:hypothetical protein